MIVTTLAAFVFFAAVQGLLVVQLADKLTPGGTEAKSAARPANGQAQYA
ncbi:hypothetical protein ACFQE0_17785 [Methylobacterium komagatae]|uniref:Uncharacterized protein n=1 Tax=Methylobacterium komagatae TaxID=374425 RepID=A0ABW2BLI9_9HYPH